MIGNYVFEGHILPTFSASINLGPKAVGADSVDIFQSLTLLWEKIVSQLGWILSCLIIGGIIFQFINKFRSKLSIEYILFMMMTCVIWSFNLYFSMKRGESYLDRYLILGVVFAVPIGLSAFEKYFAPNKSLKTLTLLLVIFSMGFSILYYRPDISITYKRPHHIQELAEWLKKSDYKDDAVLLTKMDWKSTYLPLYFPDAGGRHFVVSIWASDSELKRFLADYKPSLIMTVEGDDEYCDRVAKILGHEVCEKHIVYVGSKVKAHYIDPEIYESKPN